MAPRVVLVWMRVIPLRIAVSSCIREVGSRARWRRRGCDATAGAPSVRRRRGQAGLVGALAGVMTMQIYGTKSIPSSPGRPPKTRTVILRCRVEVEAGVSVAAEGRFFIDRWQKGHVWHALGLNKRALIRGESIVCSTASV